MEQGTRYNVIAEAKMTPEEFRQRYAQAAASPFADSGVMVESVAELTE